jgi:tetratricopeptide (TPR) repeat protein
MGSAYLNLGKPQKAVEFLKKSKTENPTYIDTHLQLGKALSRLSDFQGAIENLKEARKLEAEAPFEDFSLQAEVEYFLGQSYLGLGDVSSAKNAFNAAIDKAPGSWWAEESYKYLKNLQYTRND